MKKPKKKSLIEQYKSVPTGTSHFLRGGAGAHTDKKKEADKQACRKKEVD